MQRQADTEKQEQIALPSVRCSLSTASQVRAPRDRPETKLQSRPPPRAAAQDKQLDDKERAPGVVCVPTDGRDCVGACEGLHVGIVSVFEKKI